MRNFLKRWRLKRFIYRCIVLQEDVKDELAVGYSDRCSDELYEAMQSLDDAACALIRAKEYVV
jgi:hypothetical protein